MSVNLKIKEYLEKNGIKQAFIVDKTGLPAKMVSLIVRGERKITAEELGKIATALNVDANIFLN